MRILFAFVVAMGVSFAADAPRADAQQQEQATSMVISCPQCNDEVQVPDGATSFFCKTCGYEGATSEALLPASRAAAHAEDGEEEG